MNTYSIVLLPGDGVGPEVLAESRRVLEVVEQAGVAAFELTSIPCAGSYYADHGKEWPDGSFERCKAAHAILLGAIGHNDPATGQPVRRADGELAGYEQVIGLRMKLDLYANMRPINLFPGVLHFVSGTFKQVWDPENVDLVVFRENTEGAYSPGGFWLERGERVETVISPTIITRHGASRVIHEAFRYARRRSGAPYDGVSRVTCVDKSNVVRAHRFFRDVFNEVATEYPDVKAGFAYVDSFCQAVVREPERFDVVVAPNLPGDIITDLGSVLQGGMGMAASGNLGDRHAMFEPIHGSAPDIAGQGIANPVAAVLSVGLMLAWLGDRHADPALTRAAGRVRAAVAVALASGEANTRDLGGTATTRQSSDVILRALRAGLSEG